MELSRQYARELEAPISDRVDEATRSRIMRAVGVRNTKPELAVRSILHRLGYRFRLHRKDLPGKPDIVFPSRRKAVFVHGCFWHGHGCSKGQAPKSRPEYWGPKLDANRARDERSLAALKVLGWKTLVVWQCDLSDSDKLARRLEGFVGGRQKAIDKTRTSR
jgi:DNA mismatch endonuclease (patch repair protein)